MIEPRLHRIEASHHAPELQTPNRLYQVAATLSLFTKYNSPNGSPVLSQPTKAIHENFSAIQKE